MLFVNICYGYYPFIPVTLLHECWSHFLSISHYYNSEVIGILLFIALYAFVISVQFKYV